MTADHHSQLANFIWSICNLLRGPYKRNEYRKVILPLTVLRRFDCLLAPTKAQVLARHSKIKAKPETVVRSLLDKITRRPFYNLSKLDFPRLVDDPNQLAPNLNAYINGYSKNVREVMENFAFDQQIARMAEKNLLYEVVKKFAAVDLSPERVDNVQMGYVFEDIRREADTLGYEGRFGAGLPRINDGSLLFLQHMLAKMPKSLGNKRNKLGDPTDRPSESDQIGEITRIFGNFKDGETRRFTEEDPITRQPVEKTRVVSKVFDTADFGFHKITVERPLRLNFQPTLERIARLETERGFVKLATSSKKNEKARFAEIAEGKRRQVAIRNLLADFAAQHGDTVYKNRSVFLTDLREADRAGNVRLTAAELRVVLAALGERDETAEICPDRHGNPEPDPELRDTESVPLKESIQADFAHEVLPHVPDAWVDESKTKVGYEIPLNRHFYQYEPPRPLDAIEADIKTLKRDIIELLADVTGSNEVVQ